MNRRARLALFSALSLMATMSWTNAMRTDSPNEFETTHRAMIDAQALAPNQYRVLTPFLAELLHKSFIGRALGAAFDLDLRDMYRIIFFVSFVLTLVSMRRLLLKWCTEAESLFGCALLTAFTCVGDFESTICVSDFLQLAFVTFGFLCIAEKRDAHLLWIIPLGALNRESIFVLLGYYVAVRGWGFFSRAISDRARALPVDEIDRDTTFAKVTGASGLLIFMWAATYFSLRLVYGSRPYYCDVIMIVTNLRDPGTWFGFGLLVIAPWVMAFSVLKKAPTLIKRAALVVVPYIALHLVIGRVRETRLFLPLMPVLLPLLILKFRSAPEEPGAPPIEPKTAP